MQIQQATSTISEFQQSFASQEQNNGKGKSSLEAPAKKEPKNDAFNVALSKNEKNAVSQKLSDEELKIVEELKRVDQETRSHEQAHMAAAGQYATGGASYEYQQGPNNKRYAVAGEVSIDTSPISGDPAATKLKMQQIQRAALAPANPSPQDLRVAAQASQQALQAAAEETELRTQEAEKNEASALKKSESLLANQQEKGSSSFFSNYATKSYEDSAPSNQITSSENKNQSLSFFA